MSLISVSKCQPPRWIFSVLTRCSGVNAGVPASSNWAKPRMELSGERSSWLMLERKTDLARLASSATRVACKSDEFLSIRA
jgi:hypothetical protein